MDCTGTRACPSSAVLAPQVGRARLAVSSPAMTTWWVGDALSQQKLKDAVAVLDHPDAEQRGLRRPAVPVVVGLFADFRPDAHPKSGARRVLHARRLFRLHAATAQAAFLAGGDRRRARRRIDRHRDGAAPPLPAGGAPGGAGGGAPRAPPPPGRAPSPSFAPRVAAR